MATLASREMTERLSARLVDSQSKAAELVEKDRFYELRFNLSNELQSTLDLELTLKTFFDRVSTIIRCCGLKYQFEEKKLNFTLGDISGNTASYTVSSKHNKLGELQFYRKNQFAETELAFLEMLIGTLFFPLRNALKYRDALENSYVDTLTGINNRHALEISAFREIKLAQRHHKALSLLVIDIDHFKNINDHFGHLSGDAVLSKLAQVINGTLRESDQVFRYGGEEFIAMLSETHMDHAIMTAERIRKAIEKSKILSGEHVISVTASIGVASLTSKDDFSSLFQRADDALYKAKSEGRNKVQHQRIGSEIKKIA